jgi:hypothetical protein
LFPSIRISFMNVSPFLRSCPFRKIMPIVSPPVN